MHGSFRKFLKESIHESQKCQRNWDLDKEMPQEDIDLIIEAATNSPSKQNLNLFKLHVIQDRDIIEEIHSRTKGFGPIDGEMHTNSQVLAHVLLAFCPSEEVKDTFDPDSIVSEDVNQAIGIAAGYVNLVTTQLGYASGCCKCFDSLIDIFGETVTLLMGVGIPDRTRNRQEHHLNPNFKFPTLRKLKNIEVLAH